MGENDPPPSTQNEISVETTLEWSASRNRLLKAAILTEDDLAIEALMNDVAGCVGQEAATVWYLKVWGDLAASFE
jgi:hypothetical protein